MNRVTPKMRVLAERIIAYDSKRFKSFRRKQSTAFPVIHKLGPHLATLMGNGGYRALLLRALALASEEVAWLRTVRVAEDGTLVGLDEPAAPAVPEEILEGWVVLVAQLFGLLIAFIGESLMLRLVREIWPRLPVGNLKASKDHQNEKSQ